jgi:hypothetical protein
VTLRDNNNAIERSPTVKEGFCNPSVSGCRQHVALRGTAAVWEGGAAL